MSQGISRCHSGGLWQAEGKAKLAIFFTTYNNHENVVLLSFLEFKWPIKLTIGSGQTLNTALTLNLDSLISKVSQKRSKWVKDSTSLPNKQENKNNKGEKIILSLYHS